MSQPGGGRNKMGNLGLWLSSFNSICIKPLAKTLSLMKVTLSLENIIMLKSDFQPGQSWLISGLEIWGAESIYFEIWGGHELACASTFCACSCPVLAIAIGGRWGLVLLWDSGSLASLRS